MEKKINMMKYKKSQFEFLKNERTQILEEEKNEDKGVKTKGKKNKVAKVIYNPLFFNNIYNRRSNSLYIFFFL